MKGSEAAGRNGRRGGWCNAPSFIRTEAVIARRLYARIGSTVCLQAALADVTTLLSQPRPSLRGKCPKGGLPTGLGVENRAMMRF